MKTFKKFELPLLITESDIRQIVKECVKHVLSEQSKIRINETIAYHGSPFSFRIFGEKYITTTYYGWGIYLTSDIETAKFYACGNSNSGGYLYEVEIPNDNGTNYLHCDKFSSEEYERIYSVLIKEFPGYEFDFKKVLEKCKENEPEPFINVLNYELKSITPKEISKAFDRNGIIGINYGDSLLIFNKKNIRIVKKTFLRNRWNN